MSKLPDNIENIPFFFIIGRPRSGTTLVQTLLDAHPNVVIPPEAEVIVKCYNRFKHVTDWDCTNILELIEYLFEVWKFEFWNIEKEDITEALLKYEGVHTVDSIIRIIYYLHNSAFNKEEIKVFGDKNPRYSMFPNEMREIFPGSKIVHIVRDYRDHILSMQRVNILKASLPLISYNWRKSQKKIFNIIKTDPENIISFRYEDFAENPRNLLQQICNFLEIEFDESILDFHKQKAEIINSDKLKSSNAFFSNLFTPISTENVEKWKSKMSIKDRRRADYYVGKVAELSGYKRENPLKSLPGFITVLPGYIYIYSYYLLVFILGKIPIRIRKKIINKLPKFFPFGHRKTF